MASIFSSMVGSTFSNGSTVGNMVNTSNGNNSGSHNVATNIVNGR